MDQPRAPLRASVPRLFILSGACTATAGVIWWAMAFALQLSAPIDPDPEKGRVSELAIFGPAVYLTESEQARLDIAGLACVVFGLAGGALTLLFPRSHEHPPQ